MKPTYGVCSRYGLVAFASSLDTPGDVRAHRRGLRAHAERDGRSRCARFDVARPAARGLHARPRAKPLAGLRIGMPAEYFGGGIDADVAAAVEAALGAVPQARRHDRSTSHCPTSSCRCRFTTSSRRPKPRRTCRASTACATDIARTEYTDLLDMYKKSRAEGFGAEVKRRILVRHVRACPHGYYDAYYLKAQQVRRLIADDFRRALERCDVIMGPTAPSPAFKFGAKTDDPVQMYLNDIFTIAGNLTGAPGDFDSLRLRPAWPADRTAPVQGNYFTEAKILNVAHQYQQATDWHERAPRSQEQPARCPHARRNSRLARGA